MLISYSPSLSVSILWGVPDPIHSSLQESGSTLGDDSTCSALSNVSSLCFVLGFFFLNRSHSGSPTSWFILPRFRPLPSLSPAHRPGVLIDKQVGVLYRGVCDWRWGRWQKDKASWMCSDCTAKKKSPTFIVIHLVFCLLDTSEHPSFKHHLLKCYKIKINTLVCVKHQNVASLRHLDRCLYL